MIPELGLHIVWWVYHSSKYPLPMEIDVKPGQVTYFGQHETWMKMILLYPSKSFKSHYVALPSLFSLATDYVMSQVGSCFFSWGPRMKKIKHKATGGQ